MNGVSEGEKAKLERFKKMGEYDHESREENLNDFRGDLVKVKGVRVYKGISTDRGVRYRWVVQELGYCQRMGELFVGTPFRRGVKIALCHETKGGRILV